MEFEVIYSCDDVRSLGGVILTLKFTSHRIT